jgi:hypothetical protein
MSLGNPILIKTEGVNWDNLTSLLDLLRGCWKSSSLIWMHVNDFPILSGLVLKGWSRESEAAVSRFCEERDLSEVLVRIERPGERWTRRRGGYTIPVSEARGVVDDLAEGGMLALLLEPASPYADVYSLTCVCDLVTGSIEVEVVGPGFDASDILRSDVTPHERFVVSGEARAGRLAKQQEIQRSYLVEPGAYRTSVQKRLAKIGARLRNPSFPEAELSTEGADAKSKILAQEALAYLKASRQTLLIEHLDGYEPIPLELLEVFTEQARRLLHAAKDARVKWKELSLGGSFLVPRRLVMWDFFSPTSYETQLLSTMKAASQSN